LFNRFTVMYKSTIAMVNDNLRAVRSLESKFKIMKRGM
jgi:hypothetical protein